MPQLNGTVAHHGLLLLADQVTTSPQQHSILNYLIFTPLRVHRLLGVLAVADANFVTTKKAMGLDFLTDEQAANNIYCRVR
jgi:hypothetical protein